MRPIPTLAVLCNDPPFAQSRDAGGSREHRPSCERLSSLSREYSGRTAWLIFKSWLLCSARSLNGQEARMRSFILACLAATVIAVVGAVTLDSFQEAVSVAFATESARV